MKEGKQLVSMTAILDGMLTHSARLKDMELILEARE